MWSSGRLVRDRRCNSDGQYLKISDHKCYFIRCRVGPEPWLSLQGHSAMTLEGVVFACPPGTAVPSDYTYNGEKYSPCTETAHECSLEGETITYIISPSFKLKNGGITRYN